MARKRRRARSLSERDVPPTAVLGPGMYGPGQQHRDGPISEKARLRWNLVIGGLLLLGVTLFVVAALVDRG